MLVAKVDYNYGLNYKEELQPKVPSKKVKRVKSLNKKMYLHMVAIFLLTSLFILTGYAKITEARLEISRLENEVSELQKIKMNLEGDLEALKSTTKISEEAINNLGMGYPNEGQLVYVSINDDTEMEVADNSLSNIINKLLK